MDINLFILSLALGTQLITVFFALRLMRYAEKRVIAIVLVLMVCLMALRRLVSLVQLFSQGTTKIDLSVETVGLAISVLILYGIISIARIFRSDEEHKNAAASAELRYRTLFDQSPDGVLLVNAKGDIVEFNEQASRQLGYTREEFNKLQIADVDPVESAVDIRARFEKVQREGKDEFEVKHKTKQGDMRDVLVIVQRLELSGQTFHHTIWRDITERKQAEEAFRRSEEMMRNVLDSVDEGFIVIDRDFRILTANKAYCNQLGRPCAEVLGEKCFSVSDKSDEPCCEEGKCAAGVVFETGEPFTAFHKHGNGAGKSLYVEMKAFPLKDASGAVISVIVSISNITEKRLPEETRLKTQKLEAIGTLAGGIAHDFNNLLQGVFGYTSPWRE